jgi:hypothetical protein
MAKNTGKGYRRGTVRARSQTYSRRSHTYTKRNITTGRFMDGKQDRPFKGVRKKEGDHVGRSERNRDSARMCVQ